ncbi:MAG: hypothetical protein ACJ0P6_05755 [Flavobacteriaceae bacterium]
MEYLLNALKKLLASTGLNASIADWSSILALVIASLLVIFLLDFIIRTIIRVVFSKIASRSKTNFDDIMVAHKVPRNIAHIFPLILAYKTIPNIFFEHPQWKFFFEKFILVIGISLVIWGLSSIFRSIRDFLKTFERLKDKPIDSYIQVLMIFIWLTGIFAVFCRSLWYYILGIYGGTGDGFSCYHLGI